MSTVKFSDKNKQIEVQFYCKENGKIAEIIGY